MRLFVAALALTPVLAWVPSVNHLVPRNLAVASTTSTAPSFKSVITPREKKMAKNVVTPELLKLLATPRDKKPAKVFKSKDDGTSKYLHLLNLLKKLNLSVIFAEMNREYVVKRIKQATKENFESTVYCSAVEEYVRSRGIPLFPKLRKRISEKAKVLGIAVRPDFAKKPWSGPALWLKGQAAEEIKAAMASRDIAALEAAINKANNLEGVKFVKIELDAKGKVKKEQKVTACSKLLADAKALVEVLKKEAPAA